MLMVLLFLTGLFSGAIDAIAGGGGLISLPVLLSIGVPPHLAFGTNKLQAILGTFIATRRYHKHGLISFEKIYKGLIFGLVGAVAGALAAELLSTEILYKIIPVLLLLIFAYTIISPRLGVEDREPRMDEIWFYGLFGFTFGFYDGFFGPGVGSIWVFFLTFFLGLNLIKATAYAKVLNLNSSFIAAICFMLGGNVDYRIALCMAAGQLIGGRLGANLAIKKGAVLIRPIFLTVVTSTIAVLLYRSYANSEAFTRITQQYGVLPQVVVGCSIVFSALLILYRRRRSQS